MKLEDTLSDELCQLAFELIYLGQRGLISGANEYLQEIGLGRPHYRVLFALNSTPGITTGEILERLQIKAQSLTRTMSVLLNDGLVEQRHDLDDRRLRLHYLTERGRKTEQRVATIQSKALRDAISRSKVQAPTEFFTLLYNLADQSVRDRLAPQLQMMLATFGQQSS